MNLTMDKVADAIFRRVTEVLQEAEELGGPSREGYLALMLALEKLARERRLSVPGWVPLRG